MVSCGQDWQGAVRVQFLALFLPVEPVYKVDAFDSLHLRSHLHRLIVRRQPYFPARNTECR